MAPTTTTATDAVQAIGTTDAVQATDAVDTIGTTDTDGSIDATELDREIRSGVLDELAREPHLPHDRIGVTVAGAAVALTGRVTSHADRWAAERAIQRVDRVRAVANDITVRLPDRVVPTDREIAVATTRALRWDAFVPIDRLTVAVTDGWVTLHGEVDWEYQRRAAEWSVRRLAGVRGLSSGIRVRV